MLTGRSLQRGRLVRTVASGVTRRVAGCELGALPLELGPADSDPRLTVSAQVDLRELPADFTGIWMRVEGELPYPGNNSTSIQIAQTAVVSWTVLINANYFVARGIPAGSAIPVDAELVFTPNYNDLPVHPFMTITLRRPVISGVGGAWLRVAQCRLLSSYGDGLVSGAATGAAAYGPFPACGGDDWTIRGWQIQVPHIHATFDLSAQFSQRVVARNAVDRGSGPERWLGGTLNTVGPLGSQSVLFVVGEPIEFPRVFTANQSTTTTTCGGLAAGISGPQLVTYPRGGNVVVLNVSTNRLGGSHPTQLSAQHAHTWSLTSDP